MAATVNWTRYTGASGGPTKTVIAEAGTTRFSLSDSPTPGTANPLVIPASGSTRSWWMSEALETGATPASGGITNVLYWYAAAWGTGVTEDGGFAAAYTQAVTLDANNGQTLNQTNYSGLVQKDNTTAGASTDIANQSTGWRAAAKATWPITAAGDTTTANTRFTKYLATQLVIASTAGQGTVSNTASLTYDET